jgi:mannose-6-phosphate isomerase-like protein (cupin superfamily)
MHAGEDEMFYLLSGELVGYCGDENWTATAGRFVFVPRDQVHGYTVTGDAPAWALVITGPPKLDRLIAARDVMWPLASFGRREDAILQHYS